MWWTLAVAVAVAAAAAAAYRGDAFWCSARGLPIGTFWRRPGFSYAQMPRLGGKVVLVTGANAGLGLEVAKQCAQAGATVLLGCRDDAKCAAAAAAIGQSTGVSADRLRPFRLDLNDLAQVDLAADTLLRSEPALHVLINNAGVATQFPQPALSPQGIEVTFQVNYLGHFLLTTKLLPLLHATALTSGASSRIVHLTSGAHRAAPAEGVPMPINETGDINRVTGMNRADYLKGINDAGMGPVARYGMAKLASLAFSAELSRRHPRTILSFAVHPGVVATRMIRRRNLVAMFRFSGLGGRWVSEACGGVACAVAQLRNAVLAYSPRTAALSVLYAAFSPDLDARQNSVNAGVNSGVKATTGGLFVPVATRWQPRHPLASDPGFGARLWLFSERLVRTSLEVDLAEAPMPAPSRRRRRSVGA
jgi:NAD(P)-dependent dehydrogenase (short-subunit alcohol dehydrogenase family)